MLTFGCVLYGLYRLADIWLCVSLVLSGLLTFCCCMHEFVVLLILGSVLHGFIVLLIFDCVAWFYRFVDVLLCCMNLIVLLI